MPEQTTFSLSEVSEAAAELLPAGYADKPIRVFGTHAIRSSLDEKCLQQAVNTRLAPGVSKLVLNPDAHPGYGAPVGCVLESASHIYPGPIGVDIKCSMSLLQLNVPAEELRSKTLRRELIRAICERTPTGAGKGQRSAKKSRWIEVPLGEKVVTEGASAEVLGELGIPSAWAARCEDALHSAHDGTNAGLRERLAQLRAENVLQSFEEKVQQLGSYGGGNHFGEANVVQICGSVEAKKIARVFGLEDNRAAFLSHCGSRGFGYQLANFQFKKLQALFSERALSFPGNDKELVYAELGSEEANDYLDDMALGANFATVNHLLINQLVLEAFQEILPGTLGHLVYLISHNIARREQTPQGVRWVHRKGATRAFPPGHPSLQGSEFALTGHPILLPGNPQAGSAVMAALPGASESAFSVNHGAGRALGRRAALRLLSQSELDRSFEQADILSNCRTYPLDEAPAAYKDFSEVLRSVELAGLAQSVARLSARFVIKDGDSSLGGAA